MPRCNKTSVEAVHWMTGEEGGTGPIVIRNNKQQRLDQEWSIYEVGTPPPHNLYKPHVLVASINIMPF